MADPLLEGVEQHGAGQPRKHAAQCKGNHHVLPGRDTQEVSGIRILPHRLQAEPEMSPLEEQVDEHDRKESDYERRGAEP